METIVKILARELSRSESHIKNVITLIDEGNTIPFIARYRKEMHGTMDDTTLRTLADRLTYLRNLEARRTEVKNSIESQGKLTDELILAIDNAQTMTEVEDIYRPYKQKRRTRATIAKERGLEPLATFIYEQTNDIASLKEEAEKYISPENEIKSADDALAGASDIIAEWISDNADIRKMLREEILAHGLLEAKNAKEDDSVYAMYYEFSREISKTAGHQVLAINRGESEEFLKVSVVFPEDSAIGIINSYVIKSNGICAEFVKASAEDSYTRLIFPSIEREIRNILTDNASEGAIKNFALNLKPLLMQPPVKGKVTMGFDPAYRTGCKVAVVDGTGKVLETTVVYPTPPHNKIEEAKIKLLYLIKKHDVENIAIGNGTASRESERFIADMLRELKGVSYAIVNEAGASVYSASKLGAEEFPDYDVSLRSAVSIARRLQDPLAELVKIDPKSIGVGQYQHDMPAARLDETLGGVVEDCVNSVGVDLNTASPSLLKNVSGLNGTTAKNIVTYREENGIFTSRKQLTKVPKLGPKAFEQCAGFLRVPESKNVLDNTGVHPESYAAAEKLLELCGYTLEDVANGNLSELVERLKRVGEKKAVAECGVGVPTILDIVKELLKPGRDPRDELPAPILRNDVMEISDLTPGMVLKGTVRNVIDFGVFVDIGVHQDGLVHISQICNKFIKHPSEVLSVGDIVKVQVLEVNEAKKRISLTMRDIKE